MNLTEKHPADVDFLQMNPEVKSLEKCDNQFLDEHLKNELRTIKQKLFDLQIERLSNYINDRGKIENMPKHEEELQREMADLTVRINKFLQSY